LIGIFVFESMFMDCKTVEIPPKLMTNEAMETAINLFGRSESDMQPFVISTKPCKKAQILGGKSENKGLKHSMMMKKIVIIHPTLSMASVELKTISEKSAVGLSSSYF